MSLELIVFLGIGVIFTEIFFYFFDGFDGGYGFPEFLATKLTSILLAASVTGVIYAVHEYITLIYVINSLYIIVSVVIFFLINWYIPDIKDAIERRLNKKCHNKKK